MLFYIAAKKADKTIVESGFRSSFNLTDFRAALAANYGGVPADYYVFSTDETDARAQRAKKGDELSPVWAGAAMDEISDIEFSKEDAKPILRLAIDKISMMADGIDKVVVTASILLPDKSAIDNTFEGSIDIPCISPLGAIKARFQFLEGEARREISSDIPGPWAFSNGKISGFRVDNSISFDSIY